MKKLLLFMLLSPLALAQVSGQGWGIAKDGTHCPTQVSRGVCVTNTGAILVTFDGNDNYVNPTNITSGQVTVSIGTVTGLPAGTPPTVTDGDPGPNVQLNFGLTKGDKGDKGDQGLAGPNASKFTCSTFTVSQTGISASGCVFLP